MTSLSASGVRRLTGVWPLSLVWHPSGRR